MLYYLLRIFGTKSRSGILGTRAAIEYRSENYENVVAVYMVEKTHEDRRREKSLRTCDAKQYRLP